MNVFVDFLLIGLISNQFTCSHDILKIQPYKKILQFQHQNKITTSKHEKTKQASHLLWYVLL
jgi:hypothetical protein